MRTKQKRLNVLKWFLLVILCLYTLSIVMPLLWATLQSLRDSWEYSENGPLSLSFKSLTLGNWILAFDVFSIEIQQLGGGLKTVYIEKMFLNTILYAVGSSIAQISACVLVAYPVARFPYKFSKIIYTTVIVVMILPIVGSLPSEIYVARTLGIYNTMWGIWIMKFHFLGLYFLVMCESFRAIPKDFAEAAYIDGAGYFYTFIKIMLPIVSNMLITIFIIYFVQFWNDYQTPLIYIRTQPTLSYGLFMLKYMDGELNFLPGQMAGCLVVLFPVLLLFIIFHNRFLNNVSMGGLKE